MNNIIILALSKVTELSVKLASNVAAANVTDFSVRLAGDLIGANVTQFSVRLVTETQSRLKLRKFHTISHLRN